MTEGCHEAPRAGPPAPLGSAAGERGGKEGAGPNPAVVARTAAALLAERRRDGALKQVRLRLRLARRARSRRQFAFWTAVAAELDAAGPPPLDGGTRPRHSALLQGAEAL